VVRPDTEVCWVAVQTKCRPGQWREVAPRMGCRPWQSEAAGITIPIASLSIGARQRMNRLGESRMVGFRIPIRGLHHA